MPLRKIRSFAHLFIPPGHCGYCGFRFRRESGYYFGVLTPLLPIFALATGLVFIASYYLWARPVHALDLLWPGIVGTVVGFIVFLRPTLAIFISIDHAIDPPQSPSSQ